MDHRIAVVGSSNHRGASCFEWLAPFGNLSDYDTIIVNMTTLGDAVLEKLSPPNNLGAYYAKMEACRDQLAQRLVSGGTVIVLLEPKRCIGGRSQEISNMDWLPLELDVSSTHCGQRMRITEESSGSPLEPYLKTIREYRLEIGQIRIHDRSRLVSRLGKQPLVLPDSVYLETHSRAKLATSFAFCNDTNCLGILIALHPPDEPSVRRGIDLLKQLTQSRVHHPCNALLDTLLLR